MLFGEIGAGGSEDEAGWSDYIENITRSVEDGEEDQVLLHPCSLVLKNRGTHDGRHVFRDVGLSKGLDLQAHLHPNCLEDVLQELPGAGVALADMQAMGCVWPRYHFFMADTSIAVLPESAVLVLAVAIALMRGT